MVCPSCGAQNDPGARFCARCGADLAIGRCPNCQAEVDFTKRFCTNCGAPLEPGVAAAPAGPPAFPPSIPQPQAAPVAPAPRSVARGGCCLGTGCLVTLSVLIAVVAIAGIFVFRVPQKLGLVQPPAERLLAAAPDRSAGQAIKDEVAKGGVDVKGMEVYVLPLAGKQISVAYAVLDASKGFRFAKVQGQDPILDYMKRLATSETVRKEGIERVAIEYRDRQGKKLLTLTAPTEAVTSFARGGITREQLIQKIDGNADWPAFYQEVF